MHPRVFKELGNLSFINKKEVKHVIHKPKVIHQEPAKTSFCTGIQPDYQSHDSHDVTSHPVLQWQRLISWHHILREEDKFDAHDLKQTLRSLGLKRRKG